MTDALQNAKYSMKHAETANSNEYATAFVSSAVAYALIAIAERLDLLLGAGRRREERIEWRFATGANKE